MNMNDIDQDFQRDFAKYLYDKYYQDGPAPDYDIDEEFDDYYSNELDVSEKYPQFETEEQKELEMADLFNDPEFRRAEYNFSENDSVLDDLKEGPDTLYQIGYLANAEWQYEMQPFDTKVYLDSGKNPYEDKETFRYLSDPIPISGKMYTYDELKNGNAQDVLDAMEANLELFGPEAYPSGSLGDWEAKADFVGSDSDKNLHHDAISYTRKEFPRFYGKTLFDKRFRNDPTQPAGEEGSLGRARGSYRPGPCCPGDQQIPGNVFGDRSI